MWLKPVKPQGPQFQVEVVWEKPNLICLQSATRSFTVMPRPEGQLVDTANGTEYRLGMPEADGGD
jgi:hypothetical protein